MSSPIAIEVRLADGSTVRGHEFAADGPPVVFIHEPGRDLDAWGHHTAEFAGQGFKVLSLDLPGHGLSDGTAEQWADSLREAIEQIGRQWGPLGVVAAGSACEPFLDIGSDRGVPVQAMVSPAEVDDTSLKASDNSMRLVMCGPGDATSHQAAKAMYDGVRGQRLMVTGGGAEQGTDLIVAHPRLIEELVMWFRRYLTAYHLAWIKEITSTSKE